LLLFIAVDGYCVVYCEMKQVTTRIVRDTVNPEWNITDRHDITEILLKVALNTLNQPNQIFFSCFPIVVA
jgi:hypothetical protein